MLCRETGGLGESEAEVESTAVLSLRGGLLAHLQSRELYGGGKSLSGSADTSKAVGILDPLAFLLTSLIGQDEC